MSGDRNAAYARGFASAEADRLALEPRSPADLLRAAAALVEAALAQLDRTETLCGACGQKHGTVYDHWKIGQQFEALPEKLRNAAARLDNLV